MDHRSRLDDLFDLLSNRYRRQILHLLSEGDDGYEPVVTPADLVTETDDIETVTLQLYHSHLPKLDDSGYVEWDQDDIRVRRGPRYQDIEPVVSRLSDYEDSPTDTA